VPERGPAADVQSADDGGALDERTSGGVAGRRLLRQGGSGAEAEEREEVKSHHEFW
jgi:hypothetical protein